AVHSTICHCKYCRGQSGSPLLAWAMFPVSSVTINGSPNEYASSESGRRSFCGACGTGLFFSNGLLKKMGMVQIRIAALDNPETIVPKMQVQVAERINWMDTIKELPEFP